MRYLYVLRGFPASGKSQFIEQYNLSVYTLSSDKYRLMCGCPIYDTEGYLSIPQDVSGRAWKRLKEDLEYRMERGEFTIIDATHLSKDHILEYRKLCRKYFYKLFHNHMQEIPYLLLFLLYRPYLNHNILFVFFFFFYLLIF